MKNYMLPDDCAVLYKLVKLWKKNLCIKLLLSLNRSLDNQIPLLLVCFSRWTLQLTTSIFSLCVARNICKFEIIVIYSTGENSIGKLIY